MKRYLYQVRRRVDDLEAKIIQIPKGENEQADRLAKATLAKHMITPGNVLSFVQLSPLVDSDNMQEIGSESNWTTPLFLQAKMSRLFLRKVVSAWRTAGLARVPILVVRSSLESSRSTSSSFSIGSVTIWYSSMLMAWRWSSISVMAS